MTSSYLPYKEGVAGSIGHRPLRKSSVLQEERKRKKEWIQHAAFLTPPRQRCTEKSELPLALYKPKKRAVAKVERVGLWTKRGKYA